MTLPKTLTVTDNGMPWIARGLQVMQDQPVLRVRQVQQVLLEPME